MATSYLSPGVYVEETDTGNKPIEGVSTSTAGVVGVTERGPANVPTLITSFGDYRRTFGGYLSIEDFTDPSGRAHCYMPHAVEGLFVNGGKRVYVTRVIADEATRAARRMFFDDPLLANPPATVLLRSAEESTGTSVNPPLLYTLAGNTLANPDTIRIGDGSRAEYRTVVTNTAAPFAALNLPLQGNHIVGATVVEIARAIDPLYSPFTLPSALTAGATQIVVASTTPAEVIALAAATGELIEIGVSPAAEYAMVSSATKLSPTQVRLMLAHPLQLDSRDDRHGHGARGRDGRGGSRVLRRLHPRRTVEPRRHDVPAHRCCRQISRCSTEARTRSSCSGRPSRRSRSRRSRPSTPPIRP